MEFIFPERRIRRGDGEEITGPWYCPNRETTRGKLAFYSIVWPVISGLFLPLLETCTRQSRWETVFVKQQAQVKEISERLAEFYKAYGERLLDQGEDDKNIREYLDVQIQYLRHLHKDLPAPKE